MSDISFELLQLDDPDERAKYERSLYRAFATHQTEIYEELWEVDRRQKRLRTRIPYGGQEIFVCKFLGEVISGAAINYNLADTLRLEQVGFTVDKSQPNICEGFALFNLNFFVGNRSIALNHQRYVLEQLRQRGVERAYGTCSPKRRRGYEIMGFEFLDECTFHREQRYLMVLEL